MCRFNGHDLMIVCHSLIGRPYFASMDGKYEAGPETFAGGPFTGPVNGLPKRASGRMGCGR